MAAPLTTYSLAEFPKVVTIFWLAAHMRFERRNFTSPMLCCLEVSTLFTSVGRGAPLLWWYTRTVNCDQWWVEVGEEV